jgi:hypothetical protein
VNVPRAEVAKAATSEPVHRDPDARLPLGRPVRLPWLRRIGGRYLLAAWFAVWSLSTCFWPIFRGGFGTDAEIYYRAAAAWLSGGSPWNASSTWGGDTYHFYALPPTVLLMAPFTIIPEAIFVPGFVALQAVAAIWVLRRLRLPLWWLLFPPISVGVVVGNPSLMVMALLLAPNVVAKAFAPLVKVYAALPLVGEREFRAFGIAVFLGVATIGLTYGLWLDFFHELGAREARLMAESGGGFSAQVLPVVVPLMGIILIALAIYDFRAAGWLAPIAIWPASQLHWSTLAMPVMTPMLAAMLAMDVPGMPALAVAFHTLLVLRKRTRGLLLTRNDG